jgi:hypothetical protein
VYAWEIHEEPEGRVVAKLCGTQVHVYQSDQGASWCWEVRFADGQAQSGFSDDAETALEKGKRVAERFLA